MASAEGGMLNIRRGNVGNALHADSAPFSFVISLYIENYFV